MLDAATARRLDKLAQDLLAFSPDATAEDFEAAIDLATVRAEAALAVAQSKKLVAAREEARLHAALAASVGLPVAGAEVVEALFGAEQAQRRDRERDPESGFCVLCDDPFNCVCGG